jgi:hypothetical protein
MFARYFIATLGLLGQEYSRPQFMQALRDLRELIAVGGFDPKLYGVEPSGAIREFRPLTRDWSAPLAVHPLGAQSVALPFEQQLVAQGVNT